MHLGILHSWRLAEREVPPKTAWEKNMDNIYFRDQENRTVRDLWYWNGERGRQYKDAVEVSAE